MTVVSKVWFLMGKLEKRLWCVTQIWDVSSFLFFHYHCNTYSCSVPTNYSQFFIILFFLAKGEQLERLSLPRKSWSKSSWNPLEQYFIKYYITISYGTMFLYHINMFYCQLYSCINFKFCVSGQFSYVYSFLILDYHWSKGPTRKNDFWRGMQW